MGKRRVAKRVVCLSLASFLFAASLTGCGKKGGDPVEEAKKVDKNCIYKQEELEGVLNEGESIGDIGYVGDKVRVIVTSEKGDVRYVSLNTDGSDVQSVDIKLEKGSYPSWCAYDKDGSLYMTYYVYDEEDLPILYAEDNASAGEASSAASDEGDTAGEGALEAASDASQDKAATETTDAESSAKKASTEEKSEAKDEGADTSDGASDDSFYYLVKIDPTGKELLKFDLSKEFADEENYCGQMVMTDKYGLLFETSRGIEKFDDKDGFNIIMAKEEMGKSIGYVSSFGKGANDQLYISYYDDQSEDDVVCLLDLDKKEIGKTVSAFNNGDYVSTFFAGEGYDLYASGRSGIYGYDTKNDKLVKLVDYADSAIGMGTFTSVNRAVAISENEFIADIPEGIDSSSVLCRLVKVNPEDVVDKIQITFGGLYIDTPMMNAVMKFNRSSDKYTIKILDYGDMYPDDYDQAVKQFNLDITSGKTPDIIDVSSLNIPLETLANKGIVLDLSSQFENGGAFGDVELLPNVAEMMKVNGKFYSAIPYYTVSTYVMRASLANGKTSLTYEDCDQLIKDKHTDYNTAFGGYSYKEYLISYAWLYNRNQYVDWFNKKCNFNSPEFIDFLNFINRFPSEEKASIDEENADYNQLYAQDKALFYSAFFSSPEDYTRIKQVDFNDDIAMVGFPNNSGKNFAAIYPITVAVSSKVSNLDGAAEFIRKLFEIGNPEDKEKFISYLSSNKNYFEAMLQEACEEKDESSEDAYFQDYTSGKQVKKKPMTQEEAKEFYDYVLSIDTMYEAETDIQNIISEEASAFFSGQKTAEEVAEIIQNRVNVYINENS